MGERIAQWIRTPQVKDQAPVSPSLLNLCLN